VHKEKKMETWSWILLIVLALIGGLVGGFFGSRWLFKRELAKNPPINEKYDSRNVPVDGSQT